MNTVRIRKGMSHFVKALQSNIDAQIKLDNEMELSYAEIIGRKRENRKIDGHVGFIDSICHDNDDIAHIFGYIPTLEDVLVTMAFKVDNDDDILHWCLKNPILVYKKGDGWYTVSIPWTHDKKQTVACFSEVMSHICPYDADFNFSCLMGGRIYDEVYHVTHSDIGAGEKKMFDGIMAESVVGRSLTYLQCDCRSLCAKPDSPDKTVFFRISRDFCMIAD